MSYGVLKSPMKTRVKTDDRMKIVMDPRLK
jgi:hypothetical protein